MSTKLRYDMSISEKNAGKIPKFLNEHFFENTLNCEYKNIKIDKVEITMGSNYGENYFSAIYRVLLFFQYENCSNKIISLIVKYLPMEGRRPFGETLNIYPKEIEMYGIIIPELEKILQNSETLAPKYFNTTPDPTKTIIIKDIKSLGYSLANRQKGLDIYQSLLVIRKIAKFHAASMILAKKKPDLMKNFSTGFFHENNRDTTLQKNIFEGNIECLINIIKSWEGYEEIAYKLYKIKETLMDKCLEVVKTNDETLKVLNHGDLHINNFMFKYDERSIVSDVIFFDFQMSFYASLGIDLHYFLNTSVQLDVLKENRNQLLKSYYLILKTTLKKFKYEEIPSWKDILKEMFLTEFYGFFAFEGILPTISMNQNDCKFNNIDQYSGDEILNMRRKIMFSSDRYIETMKYSLKRFNDLKIFD